MSVIVCDSAYSGTNKTTVIRPIHLSELVATETKLSPVTSPSAGGKAIKVIGAPKPTPSCGSKTQTLSKAAYPESRFAGRPGP